MATRVLNGTSFASFHVDRIVRDLDALGVAPGVFSPMTEFPSFSDIPALEHWLAEHHATSSALWIRIFHKGSGIPSIDWTGCVTACLIWGWIDGHKKRLDHNSYIQRISPRRPQSNWSDRNIALARQLIETGRMQPSGLVRVEEAKQAGRWK